MFFTRASCVLALCVASLAAAHEGEEEDDDHVPDAGMPSSVLPAPKSSETTVRTQRPAHGASESVVGRDVIDAAPRSGATDLLRLVPGLVASQHSGEGKAQQLFLRGFDAVHGQDVELNVAGLPVNEVSHLHALGYADLNWLIPGVVREVKVTEGSARAWHGCDGKLCPSDRADLQSRQGALDQISSPPGTDPSDSCALDRTLWL